MRSESGMVTLGYLKRNYDIKLDSYTFPDTNSIEKLNRNNEDIFSQIFLKFYDHSQYLPKNLEKKLEHTAENEFKNYLNQCQF